MVQALLLGVAFGLLSGYMGHRSLHITLHIVTSVVTNSSERQVPVFSISQYAQLLGCHDVETKYVSGALGY